MKRSMLAAGLAVALGCGGDTSAPPAKQTGAPPTPTMESRTPKKGEDRKSPPADVPEPPPPSAVKKKEGTDKKDADEPKAPAPIDKPGANSPQPDPKKG